MLDGHTAQQQWAAYEKVGTDTRPRIASGWPELDNLLFRQSFGPGNLVILGGRMHTRKTTVTVNLIANMLGAGVPVGFVGLDEGEPNYVAKLASIFTGVAHTDLDRLWGTPAMAQHQLTYAKEAKLLSMTKGIRPSMDDMTKWLELADVTGARPRIVFIDYLSLLHRDKYAGKDRIPRICEDLQVWTEDNEVVTVALHQVGRTGDGKEKVHGDLPFTAEDLLYGGEQQADIILGTYRPALDPIGLMRQEDALAKKIDLAEWTEHRDRAMRHTEDTFLQLIKNRPGVQTLYEGIRLRSIGQTQRMEVAP